MKIDAVDPAAGQRRFRAPPPLSDAQFERWLDYLERRTGVTYRQHKSVLQHGLSRRMSAIGCSDYDRYYRRIQDGAAGALEWGELLNCITIGETRLFRDVAAFSYLEEYLLQRIAVAERAGGTLDLWSAGCATGEEAWSLAMVARRSVEITGSALYFGVTGTDISSDALQIARAGSYPSMRLGHVGQGMRRSYGLTDGGRLLMDASLAGRVCFVQANLMGGDALPDIDMDVIFCQNVLIDFRPASRRQVLDHLVARLKPGGLLMLGRGEAAGWRHPLVRRAGSRQVEAYIRHSSIP